MFIFLGITLFLLVTYGILISFYHRSWIKIAPFHMTSDLLRQPCLQVSIVIAARNEEHTILNCLLSIANQTYPRNLLEVIVVNDHSTDKTERVVRDFAALDIKLLSLSDFDNGQAVLAYKKKAIETGIAHASGELIITTDADCTAGERWIETIVAFKESTKAVFIAAPVKINPGNSLLSMFQSMDFLTLQGITGASVNNRFHTMCNGANMAYEKKAFYAVDGFAGIDHIASGDDLLLMQKIAVRYPEKVFYLKGKEVVVSTEAEPGLKSFFSQRIRWASKTAHYKDKKMTSVLFLVYLLNVALLTFFIAGVINVTWLFFFLLLVFTKTILEFPFIRTIASFFRLNKLIPYFPLFQPLHIIYTVIAGGFGFFGSYHWKERKAR
jgi:cellulose synthase/poly-beta-1,6-N-acetylglucosamine synthase-like glycosyltransferase